MAMPKKAIELNEQRLAIVSQIEELKAKARSLKHEMDMEIERANLLHKIGDSDIGKLKELLAAKAPDSK